MRRSEERRGGVRGGLIDSCGGEAGRSGMSPSSRLNAWVHSVSPRDAYGPAWLVPLSQQGVEREPALLDSTLTLMKRSTGNTRPREALGSYNGPMLPIVGLAASQTLIAGDDRAREARTSLNLSWHGSRKRAQRARRSDCLVHARALGCQSRLSRGDPAAVAGRPALTRARLGRSLATRLCTPTRQRDPRVPACRSTNSPVQRRARLGVPSNALLLRTCLLSFAAGVLPALCCAPPCDSALRQARKRIARSILHALEEHDPRLSRAFAPPAPSSAVPLPLLLLARPNRLLPLHHHLLRQSPARTHRHSRSHSHWRTSPTPRAPCPARPTARRGRRRRG